MIFKKLGLISIIIICVIVSGCVRSLETDSGPEPTIASVKVSPSQTSVTSGALAPSTAKSQFVYSTTIPYPARNNGLTQAVQYLEQLFNPLVGLCRETSTSEPLAETIKASDGQSYSNTTENIYWIASDNYLESLALRPYNPVLSKLIDQSCGQTYSPYQVIEGKEIPLTLHKVNNYVLEQTPDHILALNMSNGPINDSNYLDCPSYGDTLVYEAVNYYIQGYPLDWSQGLYMKAFYMFDRNGVADTAHFADSLHCYANMKLALLIFGAKVLNLDVDLTQIESQLWSGQKASGGLTSLMDSTGKPIGTANGETTAFTILAYDDTLINQIQSIREQASTKNSIDITFPATTFNQTESITKNLNSIPLLNNWKVTVNNLIQWAPVANNPRVALGFYSSLADPGDPSIQLILYKDGSLDVIKHDSTNLKGSKISLQTLRWSNPVMISLKSDQLTISSSAGSNTVSLSNFSLAYITGGSTESNVCNGNEVNLRVTAPP